MTEQACPDCGHSENDHGMFGCLVGADDPGHGSSCGCDHKGDTFSAAEGRPKSLGEATGPTGRGEAGGPKPTATEARKVKQHLRDLSAAVSAFLLDFDAEMAKRDVPDEVGRRAARLANALDLANDRVRYFALGVDFRTDKKGPSRV